MHNLPHDSYSLWNVCPPARSPYLCTSPALFVSFNLLEFVFSSVGGEPVGSLLAHIRFAQVQSGLVRPTLTSVEVMLANWPMWRLRRCPGLHHTPPWQPVGVSVSASTSPTQRSFVLNEYIRVSRAYSCCHGWSAVHNQTRFMTLISEPWRKTRNHDSTSG